MSHHFTARDTGCYADGSLGHQHVRDTLAQLVGGLPLTPWEQDELRSETLDCLSRDMSDDAWEETEAIDILNHFSDSNLVWGMVNGDLLFFEVDEIE